MNKSYRYVTNLILPILTLIFGLFSGIGATVWNYQKENEITYLDVQTSTSGGLLAAYIKNGVKAHITDNNGAEIDGYRTSEVRIYNYSRKYIEAASLDLQIARIRKGEFANKDPLRILEISVLKDGIPDDSAAKSEVIRSGPDNSVIIHLDLKNVIADTSQDSRWVISITTASYDAINITPRIDGKNVQGRPLDWVHQQEASDIFWTYKTIAGKYLPPFFAGIAGFLGLMILISARNRDKDLYLKMPKIIEEYLIRRNVPPNEANNMSFEITKLLWAKTIDNAPRVIRIFLFRPN